MSSLPEILMWKHNTPSGVECRFDPSKGDKDWVCTAFPGGIPTPQDIATWTAEYEAYKASREEKSDAEGVVERILSDPKALKALKDELKK